MPAPDVTSSAFEQFSGISLEPAEKTRIDVLLGRARRAIQDEVDLPDGLADDDLADYTDAVCALTWLYWEAEKAHVMEILALPVSQLSLGTLFWTKDSGSGGAFGTGSGVVVALNRILRKWGSIKRRRIVLEDELAYPE